MVKNKILFWLDSFSPHFGIAKSLQEKYDYELPLSMVVYGKLIGDLCEVAEINDPIEILESRGGNKTPVIKLKYELITSHNAVDTFISNCLSFGFTPKEVADMTGKTEAVIYKHYSAADEISIEAKMRAMSK